MALRRDELPYRHPINKTDPYRRQEPNVQPHRNIEQTPPYRNRLEMDVETYLKLDEISKIKYEYINGYVYAMAGGSMAHDDITYNARRMLDDLLDEKGPCQPHGPNLQLAIDEQENYVYPDVFVSCDEENQDGSTKRLHSATLIIEVLSPGTEREDRLEKLAVYQSFPSVHTYIMVHSLRRCVEVYQREGSGWNSETYGPGQIISIRAMGIELAVNSFYRRTQVAE